MEADGHRIQPAGRSERIVALDVLRGFALLGILVANIKGFALGPEYIQPSSYFDKIIKFGVDTFVSGKFIILFSLLFGISFALQMSRIREKTLMPGRVYLRRQLGLLIIGILHVVLFSEQDILVFYAILGCGLWAFRDIQKKHILIGAITIYVLSFSPQTFDRLQTVLDTENTGPAETAVPLQDAKTQQADAEPHPYTTADFLAIARYRVMTYFDGNPATHYWSYLRKFPFFLLGLYIVKAGWLNVLQDRTASLARLAAGFGLAGLVCHYLLFLTYLNSAPDWTLLVRLPLIAVGNPSLSLCYALLIICFYNHARLTKLVAPLAHAGRTALSNYVLQSIICTTFFYGYGFGLFGRMTHWSLLLTAVAIFALLVPVSAWWSGRYRFGPLEWLWRTFTYQSRLQIQS